MGSVRSRQGARHYEIDPACFAIGRRPGRCLVDRFDDLADLDAGRRTNRLDLGGSWDFEFVESLVGFDGHAAAVRGPRPGGSIDVPGLWQLAGHGTPMYLAITYPPAVDTRHIPRIDPAGNEAGIYAREFTVPAHWAGRRVSVVFEGVKAGLLVYLNGAEVGYAQGSFTPAEFDLTDLLRPGTNRLTAVVWRYTDGTYLEDQDMWFLSGIFRPVYLLAEPDVSMLDVFVRTGLDPTYTDGTISVDVSVVNTSPRPVRARVDLLLRGPDEPTRVPAGAADLVLAAGARGTARIEVAVPAALTWTAETPHLYQVVAALSTAAAPRSGRVGTSSPASVGPPIQVLALSTGIRVIEVSRGRLLVNGVPIQFHGVNRHDFDPDHAWAVPEERRRADLLAAKRLNINAIRCSHYPNATQFYDLCDELGLYVIDECDLETHGVRKRNVPGDDPRWTGAVVDRMERMVAADRNHPCVVMWSLGNEAGEGGPGGGNLARMRAAALALDPTRPFHYEGDHQPGLSDVISRMYATAAQLATLGRGEPLRIGLGTALTNRVLTDDRPVPADWIGERPVMLCEYAHAMGNSLGNFAEYMEVFDTYPRVLGGFVWDFADQSLRRVGPDGQPRWYYGGDFGERPSHRYYCNDGVLGPDRSEHPSARELHWGYRPIAVTAIDPAAGRFQITNRTSFTSADVFEVVVELRRDGILVGRHPLAQLDLPPRASRLWEVPEAVPPPGAPGEWVVRFVFGLRRATPWAPAGFEVGADEFRVALPAAASRTGQPGVPGRHPTGVSIRPGPAPDLPAGSGLPADGVRARTYRGLLRSADAADVVGRAAVLAGRPGAVAARAARAVARTAQAAAATARPSVDPGPGVSRGPGPATRLGPGPGGSAAGGGADVLTWQTRGDRWLVHGPAGSLSVCRRTGHLLSWSLEPAAGSVPVLAAPLRPNYWRALTDNDRGYGNFDSRAQQVLVDTRWRDAAPVVSGSRMEHTSSGLRLSLRLGCPLFGEGTLDYLFTPDGAVEVGHALVPDRQLYRLGLTLQLPSADTVRWYGKGPHENYVDRNHSAFTAVHEAPLAELAHRYVRPQENGNRTEVRWLEIVGPEAVLRAEDVTGGLLGFTAWPWTQAHLDQVEHDHELVAEKAVTVNIDRRQRGVGGDLPGVASLLPAYTIPRGVRAEVVVRLRVHPIGDDNPITSAG